MGVSLPLVQVATRHSVPMPNFAQPPRPLQRPLEPHVSFASALQRPCGSTLPAATALHSPMVPTWLQLTQGPLHARLQQTPSAQNPDEHSSWFLQTAPSGFFPHDPLAHSRASHCVPLVQAEKQPPVPLSQT